MTNSPRIPLAWTCEQTEERLTDYLEGLLQPEEQVAFDAHLAACPQCAPLLASVSHLLTDLHTTDEIEPPPRLVYNILDKTLGPRESVTGWRAALAWVRALANPRVGYGFASVMATFLILLSSSGFNWRKPKLADLKPANIYRGADRQVHLVYARGTKFVSDLRVVYEIQSRLNQDEQQNPSQQERNRPQSSPSDPGRTDGTNPSSPKQQNRANGVERNMQMLAASLPALLERRAR
jgi:anti-sigma factor RsiW